MKTIKLLKTLLNIILILGIAGLLLIPFVLVFSNDIQIEGEIVEEWNKWLVLKALIPIITYIIVLSGVYKLREAITDFHLNRDFNEVISKSFKDIGHLIIIGTLFHIIFNWLTDFFFSNELSFGINPIYLVHASATLFFFTLSIMIDIAKGIQRENDLTI